MNFCYDWHLKIWLHEQSNAGGCENDVYLHELILEVVVNNGSKDLLLRYIRQNK